MFIHKTRHCTGVTECLSFTVHPTGVWYGDLTSWSSFALLRIGTSNCQAISFLWRIMSCYCAAECGSSTGIADKALQTDLFRLFQIWGRATRTVALSMMSPRLRWRRSFRRNYWAKEGVRSFSIFLYLLSHTTLITSVSCVRALFWRLKQVILVDCCTGWSWVETNNLSKDGPFVYICRRQAKILPIRGCERLHPYLGDESARYLLLSVSA